MNANTDDFDDIIENNKDQVWIQSVKDKRILFDTLLQKSNKNKTYKLKDALKSYLQKG